MATDAKKAKKSADGRAYYQANKSKVNAASKKWAAENPEKAREKSRRWHETHPDAKREQWHRRQGEKIGWPVDAFERVWVEQAGCCEICGVAMLRTGTAHNSVARDHDHNTGERRGLLCFACNKAIGLFQDSSDRVQRAHAYLLKYKPLPPFWDKVDE
jgi:hypothetical protein